MSRDYVGDIAETVACSGPSRRASRPTSTTARAAVERGRAARRARSRSMRRRALAGDARPARCERPLRLAQARHRRAAHRRLGAARQDRAGPGVRARRRGGRGGLARHRPALCAAVRLGRGPRRAADRRGRAGVPPVHARPSARGDARSRSRIMPPSGNGTVSASSSFMPAARRGSTAAPATTSPAAFPRSPTPSRARRARRRAAGARASSRAAAKAAARRASMRSSSGSAARSSRRRCSPTIPAFVRLYDILFDGDEDLRELPWTERRARLEAFAAAARSRALRYLGADRGRAISRRSRRSAPARATRRSKA